MFSLLFVSVALAVAVTGLPVEDAVSAPLAPVADKADPVDQGRPDAVSAMLAARVSGKRSEDLSQRTETSSTFATPRGTWEQEMAFEPSRVIDEQGAWHDIDTDLVPVTGGFAPRYASSDVLLSDGGDKTFAGLTEDGQKFAWSWTDTLPTPSIEGDTATYANAVDGGDLVVRATGTGFRYSVVLRERPSGPVQFTVPVATPDATLVQTANDGLVVKSDSGEVIASAPAPVMWDATIDPAVDPMATPTDPAKLDLGDTADPGVVPVETTVTQPAAGSPDGPAQVTLSPDPEYLADPTTVFPVTIDPSFTRFTSGDTWVDAGSYQSTQAADEYLRVGTTGGVTQARSYVMFNSPTWVGKHILSSQLKMWKIGAAADPSCGTSPIRASRVTTAWTSAGVSWSNQPAAAVDWVDYFPCLYGWNNWNITPMVTSWANGAAQYGLRLYAPNAAFQPAYRAYVSANYTGNTLLKPNIVTSYNTKPGVPATPTIAPFATYAAPNTSPAQPFAGSTTPTFSATLTDADMGQVQQTFEVTDTANGSSAGTCTTAMVSAGTTASCTLASALTNGSTYSVRSRAFDGTDYSGYTAPAPFTVSQGTPPTPVVTCDTAANNSWATTIPTDTNSAAKVTCTITAAATPSTTVAQAGSIRVRVGNVDRPPVTLTLSSDPAVAKTTVDVPATAGLHTVIATAESVGGVLSNTTNYEFGYGTHMVMDTPAAGAPVVTTARLALNASGQPLPTGETLGATATRVRWRLAGSGQDETSGWTTAVAGSTNLTVTTSQGRVQVSGTWDTTTATGTGLDPRTPALLDVQVCVDYAAGTECSWIGGHRQVLRVPHAFGNGFPTTEVPGGQVALFTGEFATDVTDVNLPTGSTSLSFSRSAATYAGPAASTAAKVLGDGWTASLDGPDAGMSDLQVIDRTRQDGTIVALDDQGTPMVFRPATGQAQRPDTTAGATLKTGTWVPVDEDTIESGITGLVDATGKLFSLIEPDGTTTQFTTTTAPAQGVDAIFVPGSVTEPGTAGTTTYRYTGGKVMRILAPVPAGVTCAATDAGALAVGCRALTFDYATGTTAASGTPGDVAGQLRSVSTVVGPTVTKVVSYAYDTETRLVTVTDERDGNHRATGYGYDSGDRVTQITPAGLAPISYEYAGAENKLARVKRDRPNSGGTATLATVLYSVPTQSVTGLPSLTATTVGSWGQTNVPTYAAAVFGSDHPPASLDPAQIPAADWADASLSYTDAKGYTINTASNGAGGWQYTSTDYDPTGHPVRELDEGDIAAITNGEISASSAGTTTVYNTEHKSTAGVVTLAAGSVVTDVYGSTRYVVLDNGTRVLGRPHTHTTYDQGASNGGVDPNTGQEYAVPTTEITTVEDPNSIPAVVFDTVSTNTTTYADAVAGDAEAGWEQGLAGSVTTVVPGGTNIVAKTRYDTTGRVISQWQPKSTGADAGTRVTSYYTSTGTGTCAGKPAWDGSVCQTSYLGQATGKDLVKTTITSYNDVLSPLVTTEVANSATRTTTATYNSDGTAATTATATTGLSGPAAVPSLAYAYALATGLLTTTTASGGSTGSGAGTITTGYDSWGRATTYTPAAGETATTAYDTAGRVGSVTDPKGVTTYTYDGTDAAGKAEHRGLATKVTVTNPGKPDVVVKGAYDADGTVVRQDLPGGIIQRMSYDPAGEPTGLTYSGQVTDSDGVTTADQVWLGWSQDNDINGRVRREWTPTGAALTTDGTAAGAGAATGYTREYRYDGADRLTTVLDRTTTPGAGTLDPDHPDDPAQSAAAACATRDYTFDTNGNRTSLKRTPANTDGTCQTTTSTGATTKTWGYDTGDRLTTGYVYDQLGRQTTVPQTDTPAAAAGGTPGSLMLGYYDTEAARTITQAGATTTFGLEAAGRRGTSTTGPTGGTITTTTARHYTDASDNPGWVATTTGGTTTTERYAEDLSGNLGITIDQAGAVSLPVVDLHGDAVTQINLPATGNATGITTWADTDEYGNALDATAGTTPTNPGGVSDGIGYGWLGGKQRATDSTGLLLMGARLYNATPGQFTSADPVFGGNSTSYGYPQDPVNDVDLDGRTRFPRPSVFRGGIKFFYKTLRGGTYTANLSTPFGGGGYSFNMHNGRPHVYFNMGYNSFNLKKRGRPGPGGLQLGWSPGRPNPRNKFSGGLSGCVRVCLGGQSGYTGKGTWHGLTPYVGGGIGGGFWGGSSAELHGPKRKKHR